MTRPYPSRTYNPTGTLPEELIALDQWVVWKAVPKPGKPKPDKVPRDARNTRNINAHDPTNWLSHEAAENAYESNPSLAGIAIDLRDENEIVGIDLDYAIDLSTGEIAPWALEHVRELGTYCEVSPSGEGLRLFLRGTLPKEARRKVGHREVYTGGRFLTVTGNVFGAELPIVRNDASLGRLIQAMDAEAKRGPCTSSSVAPVAIDDKTIADLRSALASMRADDRDLWIGIAHDLHELGEVGRALWLEWSQTSDKYQPGDAKQWDTITSSRSGFRNVFSRAQRGDAWVNPMAGSAPTTIPPARGARKALSAAVAHAAGSVELIEAALVRPQAIRWVWPGWLARGKLHISAGAPGTGKTTIATSLIGSVTSTRALPDGFVPTRGNALIWSGEDDPADTLIPRLIAAGADLQRVRFVGNVMDGGEPRAFDPARDVAALAAAIEGWDDVALIVVDPLVAAVSGDSHKNAEVRRSLAPLVELAARLDAALLGITHFSKGTSGRDPLERVTGSLAFGALARVVFGTAKQEAEDGQQRMVFARVKSNIGEDDGGFVYSFRQTRLADYPGITASTVEWHGAIEGTAHELLSGPEPRERDDDSADAERFLAALLGGGEKACDVVKADAAAAGFTWKQMRTAKARLDVKSRKSSMEGGWVWVMPETTPKAPTRPTQF